MASDAAHTSAALLELLSGAGGRAADLEQTAVRRFAGRPDVVLFGAGGLGRRTLRGLREVGIEPKAFCDNDVGAWGKTVDGVTVGSPGDVARAWGGSAVFVVTIWRAEGGHVYGQTKDQLEGLGCTRVSSFLELYWAYPDVFLPYLAAGVPGDAARASEELLAAHGLLSDEESRNEFLAQARWRLSGDFDAVSRPSAGCDAGNEYWPDGVFAVGRQERVVDCGAYDGDTLARFLERFGGFAAWTAFEPDPLSAAAMRRRLKKLDPSRVRGAVVREAATGRGAGVASFAALGTAASSVVAGAGQVDVPVVALDDECQDLHPSLVKLDVEGQERPTLLGARGLLRRGDAVWAVSCYHRQSDLWELPLLLHELMPAARLYLRAHAAEAFDLVLYAVPAERAVKQAG